MNFCLTHCVWVGVFQIGLFVYQYAKLRMLQFHYDFLDTYVDRSDYQLCETDTESLYMALSIPNLELAVKPELRDAFFKEWNQWLPQETCQIHQKDLKPYKLQEMAWVQPPCCAQQAAFDKRTPGLFKVEYQGEGIIALCSKTYFCFGGEKDKISCKGLNKQLNKLKKENNLDVLQTKKVGGGINRGFRTDGKFMHTYQQERKSLSYLYIKRKVMEDGVSTMPLDI